MWKLYTAAVEHALDLDTITKLIGKEGEEWPGGRPSYPSISEIYGRTPEAARDWSLNVVAETVSRKVARRCYPVLHGGVGSYQQGWAFNSLLGAMCLQMMWLMTGKTRRCLWCYQILAFDDNAPKRSARCATTKTSVVHSIEPSGTTITVAKRAVSTPASRLATELNDAPTGLNSRQF